MSVLTTKFALNLQSRYANFFSCNLAEKEREFHLIRKVLLKTFLEDLTSNVLKDVTMSRKRATDFHEYRRWFWPNLTEECYKEGCSKEEVYEGFSDKKEAVSHIVLHIGQFGVAIRIHISCFLHR